MKIITHRIYEFDFPSGYFVLVDRLWPRGISKEQAQLDGHWKALAPSNELRKWYDHDPKKWMEFKDRYLAELKDKEDIACAHLQQVNNERLVLLYSAKDKQHSHALVLKEFLDTL